MNKHKIYDSNHEKLRGFGHYIIDIDRGYCRRSISRIRSLNNLYIDINISIYILLLRNILRCRHLTAHASHSL
jgi:hypothetical protein